MKTLLLALWIVSSAVAAGPVGVCREACQYWDDFADRCRFATRCEFDEVLMSVSHTACERYDEFQQRCVSEVTRMSPYQPHPHSPAPSCTERCQHWDDFQGKCLYRTRCSVEGKRVRSTQCQHWDDFFDRCLHEETSHHWHIWY